MKSVIKVWHWEECGASFDCPFCDAKEIILSEGGDEHICFCNARFQITQSIIVTPPPAAGGRERILDAGREAFINITEK